LARVITVGITWLAFSLISLILIKPAKVESNLRGPPDVFLSLGWYRHCGAGWLLSCLERHGRWGFVGIGKRHLERSLSCVLTEFSGYGIVNDNCGALGLINLLTIAILHLNEAELLRLILSQLLIDLRSNLALATHMAVDLELTSVSATWRNLLRAWRDNDCGWTEALDLDASRLALGYWTGSVG